MNQVKQVRDPSVPTLGEINFAIRCLHDALSSIEAFRGESQRVQHQAVGQARFGDATCHQGTVIGLLNASNAVRVEIDTLKHRYRQVELYEKGMAHVWSQHQGSKATVLTGETE